MTPLLKGFASAVRPPDRRRPWEWCEEHVVVDGTSSQPGRWRSSTTPWVRDLMEVFADNSVGDISVMCAAQAAKTQTLMCLICWAIGEDPGPALWVMASRDDVKEFVRDRLLPTIQECTVIDRHRISTERFSIVFASMPLYFIGSGSRSKLQSKPIRWLILDEVRNYPPGALDLVLKRTRARWNARRVMVSTPDREGDAVDRAFKAGDQRRFHFPCPSCGHLQPLVFEQLKWSTDERTKPDGKWNIDRVAETIRYECPACKHQIIDTPVSRKAIARSGCFVRSNPDASRQRVSFHWNALLPPWVSWKSLVEEFLAARAAAKGGDVSPMKAFVNESLGEPWRDQLGEIDDFDFLEDRFQPYDFGELWSDEQMRVLSADRQAAGGEHYFWICRAFGYGGRSRLLGYGRCNSLAELEEVRKRYNVPAQNSVIDSGFKAAAVYRFCRTVGWKPFKGDDAEFFLHRDERLGKVVRRMWDKTRVDPSIGQSRSGRSALITLTRWSNPSVKDLMAEHMTGLIGEWTLPNGIGRDYLSQVSAEKRVESTDARGFTVYRWHRRRKDNHYFDCELQALVVAIIVGLIASKSGKG